MTLLDDSGTSLIHWVFAVQYLKLALTFPLLVGKVPQDEILSKSSAIERIILALNIFFVTWILAMLVAQVILNLKKEDGGIEILTIFAVLSKVFSAVLLIVGIVRLRNLIRGMGHQSFTSREKLMMIHIVLFLLLIVGVLASKILLYFLENSLEDKSGPATSNECRIFLAYLAVYQLKQFVNLVILILIVYILLKLCTPLTEKW